MVAIVATLTMACQATSPFEQVAQTQALAADLLVQFTSAADASNRAVMADTDGAAAALARDADNGTAATQALAGALARMLGERGYAPEAALLDAFLSQFAEYRKVDRQILDLAAANTNRKAQQLSFGPEQEEAEVFRKALESLRPADAGGRWRLTATTLSAIAAVREIQVLQAPHIAEAGDAAMTAIEQRMAASETVAGNALRALKPLVSTASQPEVAAAESALGRFMTLNREIVMLSRRNTNVQSLALSFTEKGRLKAACEEHLKKLRAALATRGSAGTR